MAASELPFGTVSDVRETTEPWGQSQRTVLRFRLEHYDAPDDPNPVQVEMRGYRIDGSLRVNDEVEVLKGKKKSSGWAAKRAHNKSTDTMIIARGLPKWQWVMIVTFFGVVLAVIVWIIAGFAP